jgi:5-methylcytosine-specific restriction endonuclease McrA
MKSISITGKRNTDKIKSLENPDMICERNSVKKWAKELIIFYESHDEQVCVVNNLYMDVETLENREIFIKEIEKKINGYKKQDIIKDIYDKEKFIDMEYVLSKLTACKLKCHYCSEKCYILYNQVLSKTQWTIDRIDNEYGHNKGNIVIACLNCNLRRGTMDSERFKLGKQLTFIKMGHVEESMPEL